MARTELRAAIAACALLLAPQALACGYCVEDKVAATYDHGVVTKALGRGHAVAFFHIDGPVVPGDAARRRLTAIVESIPGVSRGSARVSADALTLSLAFDPQRLPLAVLEKKLDRGLAARKLSAMAMRVMDRPADLKAVSR